MLENISKSYYGLLSNAKLVKYIVNPISNSIFSGEMVNNLSASESESIFGINLCILKVSVYRTSSLSESVSALGKSMKKKGFVKDVSKEK